MTTLLTREKLLRVMGVEYTAEQVSGALVALGFDVDVTDEAYQVKPPYWRPDIVIPEDVAEEVGRIIGYDVVPIAPGARAA